MCGPATPRVDGLPCGVFSWRPPVALVEELSDLLDGRVVTRHERSCSSRSTSTTATSRSGRAGAAGRLQRAGVLTAADVHVATNLGRLGGETETSVLLAVALAVRAVRHGSVCLELAAVAESLADLDLPWPDPDGVVGGGRAEPPPRGRCRPLGARAALPRPLPRAGDAGARRPAVAPGQRRRHRHRPARRSPWRGSSPTALPTSSGPPAGARRPRPRPCITGGPGTGKTTAVAGLLVALRRAGRGRAASVLRIALAAPTGKAAARLEQAVRDSATRLLAAGPGAARPASAR